MKKDRKKALQKEVEDFPKEMSEAMFFIRCCATFLIICFLLSLNNLG